MQSWFFKRDYTKSLVEKKLRKVKFSNKVGKWQLKEKDIPFAVTYHPTSKNIGNIIRRNLYLLYMNKEAKKVVTLGPMISFCRARKLTSYLVGGKTVSYRTNCRII